MEPAGLTLGAVAALEVVKTFVEAIKNAIAAFKRSRGTNEVVNEFLDELEVGLNLFESAKILLAHYDELDNEYDIREDPDTTYTSATLDEYNRKFWKNYDDFLKLFKAWLRRLKKTQHNDQFWKFLVTDQDRVLSEMKADLRGHVATMSTLNGQVDRKCTELRPKVNRQRFLRNQPGYQKPVDVVVAPAFDDLDTIRDRVTNAPKLPGTSKAPIQGMRALNMRPQDEGTKGPRKDPQGLFRTALDAPEYLARKVATVSVATWHTIAGKPKSSIEHFGNIKETKEARSKLRFIDYRDIVKELRRMSEGEMIAEFTGESVTLNARPEAWFEAVQILKAEHDAMADGIDSPYSIFMRTATGPLIRYAKGHGHANWKGRVFRYREEKRKRKLNKRPKKNPQAAAPTSAPPAGVMGFGPYSNLGPYGHPSTSTIPTRSTSPSAALPNAPTVPGI